MIKRIFIFLSIFLIISCSKEENVLSEDKCVEVFYEIHRADAILSVKNLTDKKLKNDSLSYYNYVFKKCGISRYEFMQAVDFLIDHPKEYLKIYTKVVKMIDNEDVVQRKEKKKMDPSKIKPNDIWNKDRAYYLPLDGDKDPIYFEIPVEKNGIYTLEADMRYYEDDGTVNPRMTLMVVYTDESSDMQDNNSMKKNGKTKHITVKLRTNDSKIPHYLKGWISDHSDVTTTKHQDIENITLTYDKD